jgi:hypothetical protein
VEMETELSAAMKCCTDAEPRSPIVSASSPESA